jgi:hypothetical protein
MGRHVLLPIFPRVLKRPCGVAIGSRKSLEKILLVPAFLLTVDPTPAERNFNSSKVGNIGFVRMALGDLEPVLGTWSDSASASFKRPGVFK